MKVTHIFHSGFMLEMKESVLLFDWYTGELPALPAGKRLYVFCSHAHGDHYSPVIWDLQKKIADVTYILDAGIPDAKKHPEAEVVLVEPHQIYDVHALRIRTLTSTDMGVAFYIETEGKRIYHAGDLNVWYWNDEPMEDNIASEKMCRAEMQSLADDLHREEKGALAPLPGSTNAPLLDVAFVPLDPRLEEHGPRCMVSFLEILDANYIFPMHYWEREEEVRDYFRDERLRPFTDRMHLEPELVIE